MLLNQTFEHWRIFEWCERERVDIQRQIEMLESGEMRTTTNNIDTTEASLILLRGKLVDLTRLINDMRSPEFSNQVNVAPSAPIRRA